MSATSLALVGGTVVDVLARACVPDQTVVVTGDRITAVGPRATTAVPADARRFDVPDRWVVPGLVDMHCHLTGTPPAQLPLEQFLAHGVTTVRDPGGQITAQRLLRQSVRRGERIGPRLLVSGELLDGDPPVWPGFSLVVDTPERATAAVAHLAAQGADFVKVYNHLTADVLAAIVAAAGERGLPVTGHVPRRLSMRRAVELGLTGLEHIRITGSDFLPAQQAQEIDPLPVTRREPLLWERIDVDAPWVEDLVDLLAAHRVTLDPTLVVDEVAYVDRAESPEQAAAGRAANEKRRQFVGRCAAAGVRIVAGTDGAGPGKLRPGYGLHHELALLRAAGLSAFDALRAATIEAARTLRADDDLGSVSPGRRADLGVWSVSPLGTHLKSDDLDLVVAAGTPYRPAELARTDRAEAATGGGSAR